MNVLTINFQSIKSKREPLWNLVEECNPDIILGCETWFTSSIGSKKVMPPDYDTYRKDSSKWRKSEYSSNDIDIKSGSGSSQIGAKSGSSGTRVNARLGRGSGQNKSKSDHGPSQVNAKPDCDSDQNNARSDGGSGQINADHQSEIVATHVTWANNTSLVIGSFYRQPNRDPNHSRLLCDDIASIFRDHQKATIWIAGDANLPNIHIDWNTDNITGNRYPKEINENFLQMKIKQVSNKSVQKKAHNV